MEHETLEIITERAEKTQKAGENLARQILKRKRGRQSLVIGLEGELGSGKTTFIQGLAMGLGIKDQITSPTFVIMKKYRIRTCEGLTSARCFYHIDCYRLNKPKDLLDLDFKEILENPENIIVIEWAEKVKKILPKNTLWIEFEHINRDKRKITLNPLN